MTCDAQEEMQPVAEPRRADEPWVTQGEREAEKKSRIAWALIAASSPYFLE
jgi:hypothetical protein